VEWVVNAPGHAAPTCFRLAFLTKQSQFPGVRPVESTTSTSKNKAKKAAPFDETKPISGRSTFWINDLKIAKQSQWQRPQIRRDRLLTKQSQFLDVRPFESATLTMQNKANSDWIKCVETASFDETKPISGQFDLLKRRPSGP
jgi:hypothetical protein